MLLELWRWKPRLVWLVMHAATLGLLWCARAWPTQPHFVALLATTAALYVSVSFVDPGYVELASASAATPDRASLSALTVPLVLQACSPCTYDAPADAIADCTCHALMPCTCHAHMPCAHACTCHAQPCTLPCTCPRACACRAAGVRDVHGRQAAAREALLRLRPVGVGVGVGVGARVRVRVRFRVRHERELAEARVGAALRRVL